MKYGSICDGMGAAHVASRGLGWNCEWLAEIDPQASSTTAHHYPDVPNLGDIMAADFAERALAAGGLDVLVGGTPCQSFSIAGLRKGLTDDRGNLTLRFVELADAVGHAGGPAEVVFWENVGGVLSDKTNAFGCFLAALVGEDTPIPAPRSGWTNAGLVVGPARTAAWRVIDAQGFVAQRRRRVFVVAARHGSRVDPERVLFETEADALRHLGDREHTGPLFPEREGMCGDTAASGSAGEIVAALTANGVGTCGADDNQGQAGHLIPVAYGGGNTSGPITVSTAMTAHPGGRYDFDTETLVTTAVSVALRGREGGGMIEMGDDVAHALRALQGGGDKPHVLAPVAYRTSPNCGAWETGDRVDALTTGTDPTSHLIAFTCKDHGADAGPISPTLRAMGHDGSHANAGGQVAVAYPLLEPGARTGVSTTDVRAGMGIGSDGDPMFTLQAGKQHGVAVAFALNSHAGCADGDQTNRSHASGGPVGMGISEEVAYALRSGRTQSVSAGMAVRRLLPTECLKLQSFPPDYFDGVMHKGKPLADGPQYKQIGNSWNTDAVRWVFRRIDAMWRGKAVP